MDDLVSVIIPAYNSEKFIAKAIESIINQTYRNWELIIINDASTDNTEEIIEFYKKNDKRIKVYKNSNNLGPAKTRNRGILESKGEYISFLDSDDIWYEFKLEKQLKFIKENNFQMSHGNYRLRNEKEKLKEIKASFKLDYKALLRNNEIKTSFLMIKKDILKEIKFPDRKHEDYAFFLDILKNNTISYCLEVPLGIYQVRKNSLSGNKFKSALWTWKIYREYENLKIRKSIFYFTIYILRSLKKYYTKR